jgi:hypothetical protein
MTTNPFINNVSYKPTQDLLEELSIESIKMHGMDVYYIPRKFRKKDDIFGEDALSYFSDHFKIEAYLENNTGFAGDGQIIQKFGVELKQEIVLTLSRKRFAEEAAKLNVASDRPAEIYAPFMGDLIYFPLSKALFEIKYVEPFNVFFQQGKLYTYQISCELFKYSMENINTGNSEIDRIEDDAVGEYTTTQDGTYLMDKKTFNENSTIQSLSDNIIDFTDKDPFSQGNY